MFLFERPASHCHPWLSLRSHERHLMVDSKLLLQIEEKRNANIFRCRSRRILKLASKIKKNKYNFVLCGNKWVKTRPQCTFKRICALCGTWLRKEQGATIVEVSRDITSGYVGSNEQIGTKKQNIVLCLICEERDQLSSAKTSANVNTV